MHISQQDMCLECTLQGHQLSCYMLIYQPILCLALNNIPATSDFTCCKLQREVLPARLLATLLTLQPFSTAMLPTLQTTATFALILDFAVTEVAWR